jgi:methionyl-tRNA synthetase
MATKVKKRILVTSALPYVNGVKHLGNMIGSLLPADVFHRYLDILGTENIFICGTDEHGTAIEIAALEEGLSPQAYSDKYYAVQKEVYERWELDFTFFGRTSAKIHHEITQNIFLALNKNGYIKSQKLKLPYCKNCNRYLPDRFILGKCPKCSYERARGDQCEKCGSVLDPEELIEPSCSICKKTDIKFRLEDHLFLDLPKAQAQLKKWIRGKSWPANVKTFALGWIKEGLKPRCITRNLKWGVRVPLKGYEHLVFYVWFDAPIGYISMTAASGKDVKKWWADEKTQIYHFLGKDNIPFHTIIWPAMLIASKKYKTPDYVAGYEYLNWEGEKFSTSRGVGLFSDEALELFPTDYWRYYLLSILPETKDSNFDWDDFKNRINNELIANYGNLFYRVTHFIEQNFDGKVPKPGKAVKEEKELKEKLEKAAEKIKSLAESVRLREALHETMAFSSEVNKYFQQKKPWEEPKKAGTTIYTAINALSSISTMLYPFIPKSSEEALECMGQKIVTWEEITKDRIKAGTKIKAKILFKKIEDAELEKAKKYKTKHMKSDKKEAKEKNSDSLRQKSNDNEVKPMVSFDEFKKMDMRVGTIIKAEDHPNANKLYVLQADLGNEKRQIVAGLKGIYSKEELKNKQIIMVVNLQPVTLRGVESRGMLLAAEDGTIISPEKKLANGTKIM